MTPARLLRLALGAALAVQAAFAALTLLAPGWRLVDLDAEENLPTWFHSGLLTAAAVAALHVLRLEARLLRSTGRPRTWAAAWLGVACLFGYLALDESLAIHEGFYTAELRGWLRPDSPLQLTLAWLLVFLPGIVAAVAFLLASFGARSRMSPRLVAWAGAGLGLWIVALTLEGTAKSFFIPRGLYTLEVVLEETAESLGTTLFAWGFWRYRAELAGWLRGGATAAPPFAVPWRWVAAGTVMLAVPAAVVTGSIVRSSQVLQKYVGDGYLREGRLDEAVRAYRGAVTLAPSYAQGWDRLGIAEYRRGEFGAAEAAFATAERLDPRAPGPANHRGAALLKLGRVNEAVEALTRAARLGPRDAEVQRNLGLALRRLGREQEAAAAFGRAEALEPRPATVVAIRVSVPADLPLAYVADPRLDQALTHTLAGRPGMAAREYRRTTAFYPGLAAAHLGLANELLRSAVARRVAEKTPRLGIRGAEWEPALEPTRPATLFVHWVRRPDGSWEEIETTVAPSAFAGDARAAAGEAGQHYERALALGAGAAAHLGLALLAREEGQPGEAARRLAAARAVEPGLAALQAVAAALAAR